MKKLITLLFLLLVLPMIGQTISPSVSQDLKLATIGDVKRDYHAPKIDILLRVKLHSGIGVVIFPEFEYADLYPRYARYSLNVGYKFNIGKIYITPHTGFGFIDRGIATNSFSGGIDLTYDISNRLTILASNQLVDRSDLGFLYDDRKIKYSLFVGVEYNIKLKE